MGAPSSLPAVTNQCWIPFAFERSVCLALRSSMIFWYQKLLVSMLGRSPSGHRSCHCGMPYGRDLIDGLFDLAGDLLAAFIGGGKLV